MRVQVYLTDSSGTREISSLITRASWAGDEASVARKLSISMLHDEEEPWPVPALGNGVVLSHEGERLFAGYVVERTLDSESSTLEVTCYDRGIYLTNNDGTYKFRQTTAEGMVRTVCEERGIPIVELAATGVPLNRKFSGVALDRIARTAYSLAAEQTGERYSIRMTPEGLSITVRAQSESSLNLRPRSNLMYATTTESIVDMVNSVGIYDQQGRRLSTVADSDAIALYGTMERHLQQTEDGDAYGEAQALLEDNGLARNVQVEVLGDIRLVTGETVVVEEESTGLRGIFWIDADTHTWQRDQYTCKLTLNCRNVMTKASSGSDLDE